MASELRGNFEEEMPPKIRWISLLLYDKKKYLQEIRKQKHNKNKFLYLCHIIGLKNYEEQPKYVLI